jgi:hypothetical protein
MGVREITAGSEVRSMDGAGFSSVAAAITAIVLGANTPLPLLTVYQTEWGFSTALLTIIYGLYTVGVVITVFLVELTDRIAPRETRAEVFSGFQLGLYVGATVPAVVVGFAATALGFRTATLSFIAVVAALAVMGLVWIRASRAEALQP